MDDNQSNAPSTVFCTGKSAYNDCATVLSYDVLIKIWNLLSSVKDRIHFASCCCHWRSLLRSAKWPAVRGVYFEKLTMEVKFFDEDSTNITIALWKLKSASRSEKKRADDDARVAMTAFLSRLPNSTVKRVELKNASGLLKRIFPLPKICPWKVDGLFINDIQLLDDLIPNFIDLNSVTCLEVRDPRSRLIISDIKFACFIASLSFLQNLKVLDITLNEIYRSYSSCYHGFESHREFVNAATSLEEIRINFGKSEHRLIGSPPFCDFARLGDLWPKSVKKIDLIDTDPHEETNADVMNSCYLHSLKVMELLERELSAEKLVDLEVTFHLRATYWPYPSGPIQKNGYTINVVVHDA